VVHHRRELLDPAEYGAFDRSIPATERALERILVTEGQIHRGRDRVRTAVGLLELQACDVRVDRDLDGSVLVGKTAEFVVDDPKRAALEDVTDTIGAEFAVGAAAEEVDTLGGYLVLKAGHVPVRGELVAGPGTFEIEVLDADPRRVKRVRIYRSKDRLTALARDQRRRAAEHESPPAPNDAAAAETAAGRDRADHPSSDISPPKTVHRP